MPFQSEKQRKYLWANEPAIAKRWEKYPKGYNTGGVSHLFRSKEDRTGFNKGTEKKDGTGLIIWGKSVAEQWPNLNESQKDYIRKHWPQHVPKGHAQGGYIRPEEDGVLGLADGGRIGFNAGSMLVAPTTDGSRPGYAYDDYEDMGFGDGADMGSPSNSDSNDGDDGGVPDYESGSPENTWATMSDEMEKKSRAETKRILGDGDHGDPMGNPDEQAKYAKYIKTVKNQIKDTRTFDDIKNKWENDQGFSWKKTWEGAKTAAPIAATLFNPTPLGIGKLFVDQYKKNKALIKDIEKDIKRLKDLGVPTHSPHTDTLIQKLDQKILNLTQVRKRKDDENDDDIPTTIAEVKRYPTKEEMMAAARRAYEMLYGDRRSAQIPEDRSKQMAYYNAYKNKYMSAKGGRVPGYNTGGLSSLFRLKNK